MNQRYRITAVSRLMGITPRTLRYYDKMGLLKPSYRSTCDYRLYTSNDLYRLQHIIALKFLGFSLKKISTLTQKKSLHSIQLLETQISLLSQKIIQLKKSTMLLLYLTHQLDKKTEVPWETLHHLIPIMRLSPDEEAHWQKYYYSPSEYQALETLTRQKTERGWKCYLTRWKKLFKRVEAHLHTDPASSTGQMLATQWLALVDEAYHDTPLLRKKAWEAYQAGLVPETHMPHHRGVIDYINRSIKALNDATPQN